MKDMLRCGCRQVHVFMGGGGRSSLESPDPQRFLEELEALL